MVLRKKNNYKYTLKMVENIVIYYIRIYMINQGNKKKINEKNN